MELLNSISQNALNCFSNKVSPLIRFAVHLAFCLRAMGPLTVQPKIVLTPYGSLPLLDLTSLGSSASPQSFPISSPTSALTRVAFTPFKCGHSSTSLCWVMSRDVTSSLGVQYTDGRLTSSSSARSDTSRLATWVSMLLFSEVIVVKDRLAFLSSTPSCSSSSSEQNVEFDPLSKKAYATTEFPYRHDGRSNSQTSCVCRSTIHHQFSSAPTNPFLTLVVVPGGSEFIWAGSFRPLELVGGCNSNEWGWLHSLQLFPFLHLNARW